MNAKCSINDFFFFTNVTYVYVSGPANKDKNDLNASPNDALLQPDGDKVFYENLPFHGMQNPPNKVR